MNIEEQVKKEKIEAFTKKVDIKPCPFCGNTPILFDGYNECYGHGSCSSDAGIECPECKIMISFNDYNGYQVEKRWLKALAIWNKRIDKNDQK